MKASDDVLVADLGEKKLYHIRESVLQRSYPLSYGARTRSCQAGSLGTPWGLHEISTKHGHGEVPGMVFTGRVATGATWMDCPDAGSEQKCLVSTRILRLRGLEAGLNAGPGMDSHDRYIYIHGTNHPEKFPENISAGCIQMLDEDLIDLFEKVPEGTQVWLSHPKG